MALIYVVKFQLRQSLLRLPEGVQPMRRKEARRRNRAAGCRGRGGLRLGIGSGVRRGQQTENKTSKTPEIPLCDASGAS